MKTDLKGLYFEEISDIVTRFKQPAYRAKQLTEWIYTHNVYNFSQMKNLPPGFRAELDKDFFVSSLNLLKHQHSKDGTEKSLFSLNDNEAIETVLMRYKHGNTVCISSQAGCAMKCAFCTSGLSGLKRNLTTTEMLDQVLIINNMLSKNSQRVSHVVIMGIGEPLTNYDNVLKFMKLINKKYCLGISFRRISLSTCGIVPKIYKLAEENLPITLSVSLHAGNSEKRDYLMPVNKKYPLEELLKACKHYAQKTKRQISFEYCLIKGINDQNEDAENLSKLLKDKLFHVNLIPLNPAHNNDMASPEYDNIQAFKKIIKQNGIPVTIRRSCGNDIDAACGQLRLKSGKS